MDRQPATRSRRGRLSGSGDRFTMRAGSWQVSAGGDARPGRPATRSRRGRSPGEGGARQQTARARTCPRDDRGHPARVIARAPYRWDFRSPPMGICDRRALGMGQRAADDCFVHKGRATRHPHTRARYGSATHGLASRARHGCAPTREGVRSHRPTPPRASRPIAGVRRGKARRLLRRQGRRTDDATSKVACRRRCNPCVKTRSLHGSKCSAS